MWGNSTNRSSWRWLDPSPSNVTFQPPWEAGQPNYCGQPAKEKSCAGLWALGNLTQPLLLGDLPCNCSMPYICKTEVGANVSGGPETARVRAEHGAGRWGKQVILQRDFHMLRSMPSGGMQLLCPFPLQAAPSRMVPSSAATSAATAAFTRFKMGVNGGIPARLLWRLTMLWSPSTLLKCAR